jgi:hypothetical protein
MTGGPNRPRPSAARTTRRGVTSVQPRPSHELHTRERSDVAIRRSNAATGAQPITAAHTQGVWNPVPHTGYADQAAARTPAASSTALHGNEATRSSPVPGGCGSNSSRPNGTRTPSSRSDATATRNGLREASAEFCALVEQDRQGGPHRLVALRRAPYEGWVQASSESRRARDSS